MSAGDCFASPSDWTARREPAVAPTLPNQVNLLIAVSRCKIEVHAAEFLGKLSVNRSYETPNENGRVPS